MKQSTLIWIIAGVVLFLCLVIAVGQTAPPKPPPVTSTLGAELHARMIEMALAGDGAMVLTDDGEMRSLIREFKQGGWNVELQIYSDTDWQNPEWHERKVVFTMVKRTKGE